MYRRQGEDSVIRGVLSGAYTGGSRRVDASKLPRSTRERLAAALAGRAEPSPILSERGAGLASRAGGTWALIASLVALVALTAVGFANPAHAWAHEPRGALVLWLGAGALFAWSLLSIARRRARVAGGALPEGRWLLPLDVVEVSAAPDGGQLVTVTPLGDARDASIDVARAHVGAQAIVDAPSGRALVLTFEHGAVVRFAVRSARDAEIARGHLERSQRLLEELTFGRDIAKALAHDAFFDVRVDDSWRALAPDPSSAARARAARLGLQGVAGAAAAAALAALVGVGGFAARNRASDHALSARRAAESAARRASRGSDAKRSEEDLTPAGRAQLRGTPEACVTALRLAGAPAHPEVARIMESVIARAQSSGDPVVPVRFVRRERGVAPPDLPPIDFASRERTVTWAFERVFSDTCPAAVVRFDLRAEAPPRDGPALDVAYEVSWPPRAWRPRANPYAGLAGETYLVHGMHVVFDVELRGLHGDDKIAFRLTMPPPDVLSMSLRPRSLFVVAGAPPVDGTFDARVYDVMTARAFDRLYDEIYGLFFGGDPRVPLRESEAMR